MNQVDYGTLVRRNRDFRRLWIGQIVSELGDWFNSVAVYALLLDLTQGSATAVAWIMVVQFLPVAIVGPLAGVIVDRFDRRRIMIATDVVRGVLILGLLLVDTPAQVWVAYVVMSLTVLARAFFEPARTAMLPEITSADELLAANALSSASWAAMLAIGAALGGVVAATIGRDAAFLLNSVSFFLSAVAIAGIRRIETAPRRPGPVSLGQLTGVSDFLEGLRYIRAHLPVLALLSVKAGWGIAGGALLLLTIFGERVFRLGGDSAAGIGLLFCARGIGAGLGGLLTKQLGYEPGRLRGALGPAYLMFGVFYLLLGTSPTIWMASLAVLGAHGAGSVLWVASTVLLQSAVPDRFRGRVFAVEFAFMTLVAAAATYLTGYALDDMRIDPRTMAAILGVLFCLPGLGWVVGLGLGARASRSSGAAGPVADD